MTQKDLEAIKGIAQIIGGLAAATVGLVAVLISFGVGAKR